MPTVTLEADFSEMRKLVKGLDELGQRGQYFAAKDALRGTTAEANHLWRENMGERLTIRNKWTQGSIRNTAPRGSDLGALKAIVGSMADYMALTEEGGSLETQGKHGRPIPLDRARVGQDKSRLVARRNRMSRIDLTSRSLSKFRNKRQKIAVAAAMAKRKGEKFVIVETDQGANIYELKGSNRRPKMRKVWNLEKRTVSIPAHPTMQEPMRQAGKNYPKRFAIALRAQVYRSMRPLTKR